MAETPKVARWKLVTGYALFGLLSFVLFLFLTFPYDVVQRRAETEARKAGWRVTMGKLGPGLFGVTAKDVKLMKVREPGAPVPEGMPEPPPPEPLQLSRVSVRPALFPPGLAIRAQAFGGVLSANVGMLSDLRLDVSLRQLDPSQGNLKAFTGIDMTGKLGGELSLVVPRSGKEYDLGAADGGGSIELEKLMVNGGTVTVPMYGQPTPMDLPKIAIGDLQGKLKIEKGLATLDQFRGKSEDLELAATGTIKLNKRPDFSELNVDLKLKAEPEFVKRLGLIGSGLSMLPSDKENPQFRVARMTGYLGRPNFGPGVAR